MKVSRVWEGILLVVLVFSGVGFEKYKESGIVFIFKFDCLGRSLIYILDKYKI